MEYLSSGATTVSSRTAVRSATTSVPAIALAAFITIAVFFSCFTHYATAATDAAATTGEPNWDAVGLFGFGAGAIAPSANYVSDDTVFTASNNKGSYRTTDRGLSWAARTEGNADGCYQIAVSPSYPSDQTMLCAGYSNLHRSTDGGASWDVSSNGLDLSYCYACLGDIAMTPNFASSKTVFMYALSDLYKSDSGGTTWDVTSMGLGVNDIETSPGYALDQTLFVATSIGVYISTDGGSNWKPRNTGLLSTNVLDLAISSRFASDKTIFAATAAGVFKSTDAGATWTLSGKTLKKQYVREIILSSTYYKDNVVVIAAGGTLMISTDGGNAWRSLNAGLPSTTYTIAAAPNFLAKHTLFAASSSVSSAAIYKITLNDVTAPRVTAPYRAKGKKNKKVKLYYKVKDAEATSVYATVQIETKKGRIIKVIRGGWKAPGKLRYVTYKVKLKPGTYPFEVYAKDKAGNRQLKVARNKLIVK